MQLRTSIVIEHGPDGRTDRNVTGNVIRVHEGDAVEQAECLAALQLVFRSEFDRGEMTVGALQLELWQAHWYRASRLAMQRAADMLVLAAASGIPANGKLARECEGLAKVLDLFVNAKPKDHPIGDALLRGEPIPAGDGARHQELAASALRADGMHPTALLTSEESQALAEQIRSTADAVETVGAELDEKAAQAAEGAASTVGTDDQAKRIELLEENLTISRQICLNELTLLTRGLTALAKEIGPIAYERTLQAMERPA